MRDKRGLSDIVTTVLIILLVIIAVIILWMLLRPIIFEDTGDASQITVQLTLNRDLLCVNKPKGTPPEWRIILPVERSAGEGELMGFDFLVELKNGDLKVFEFLEADDKLSEGSSKNYELNQISEDKKGNKISFVEIHKITLMPVVRTSKGTETASNIREEYVLTGYERECGAGGVAGPAPKPGGGGIACEQAGLNCLVCSEGNCVGHRSDLDSSCGTGKRCCSSCSAGGGGGGQVYTCTGVEYNCGASCSAGYVEDSSKTCETGKCCKRNPCVSPNSCLESCTAERTLSNFYCADSKKCCMPEVTLTFCECAELTNADENVKKVYKLVGCPGNKLDVTYANLKGTGNGQKACFVFKNKNIELDLNGVEVKYTETDPSKKGCAVYGNGVNDVVVKKGKINNFVPDTSSNDCRAQVTFHYSAKIELVDLSISGNGNTATSTEATWLSNVDNSKVDRCVIENSKFSILFTDDSDNNYVTANTVKSCYEGVHFSSNCDNNEIRDNLIIGPDASVMAGIVLWGAGNKQNKVLNNSLIRHGGASKPKSGPGFVDQGYSLWGSIDLYGASENLVKGNNVTGARSEAITIDGRGSDNNQILMNNITGTVHYGILVYASKENYIDWNNISESKKGIFLSGDGVATKPKNNLVRYNYILGKTNIADLGAITLYDSHENLIYFNNLFKSGTSAISLRYSNENNITENSIKDSLAYSISFDRSNSNYGLKNYIFGSVGKDVYFENSDNNGAISRKFGDFTIVLLDRQQIPGRNSIHIDAASTGNRIEDIDFWSEYGTDEANIRLAGPITTCDSSDNNILDQTYHFSQIPESQDFNIGCTTG